MVAVHVYNPGSLDTKIYDLPSVDYGIKYLQKRCKKEGIDLTHVYTGTPAQNLFYLGVQLGLKITIIHPDDDN